MIDEYKHMWDTVEKIRLLFLTAIPIFVIVYIARGDYIFAGVWIFLGVLNTVLYIIESRRKDKLFHKGRDYN